jgi:hypothetical protein
MTVWAEQSTTSTNWELEGTFFFKTEDDLFFLATEDNNTLQQENIPVITVDDWTVQSTTATTWT